MTDSSVLADLRDQIVRLQQQWRADAKDSDEHFTDYGDGLASGYRHCAQRLNPLLTLVRSLQEQEKNDLSARGQASVTGAQGSTASNNEVIRP
jgi:hypothetical protein